MDRKAKNIQIYIKTDRPADWLPTSDIYIGRQAGRPAGRQAERQTDRQTDIKADRQTDRRTDIQTDRKRDRKTDVGVISAYGAECTVLQYTGGEGGTLEAP